MPVQNREIIRAVLSTQAKNVLMMHNRILPARCAPTAEDIDLTRRVMHALESIEVLLVDHLIIGTDGYFSFMNNQIGDTGAKESASADVCRGGRVLAGCARFHGRWRGACPAGKSAPGPGKDSSGGESMSNTKQAWYIGRRLCLAVAGVLALGFLALYLVVWIKSREEDDAVPSDCIVVLGA